MITPPVTFLDKQGSKPLSAQGSRWTGPLLARLRHRTIVLARSASYFVEEEVALTSARDIRAYLKSNASVICPFPSWQALFVARQRTSATSQAQPRTRLAIWFYDPALVESVAGRKTCLLIPEDLAIARQSAGRSLYLVGDGEQQRYLLYANRGQLLNTEFLAGDEGAGIQDDVRELSGLSPAPLNGPERDEAIRAGVKGLGVKELAGLLKLPGIGLALDAVRLRTLLLGGAVAAGFWLATTSAVIQYQQNQMQQAMDSLSGDLKTVLAANRTEQKLRERLEFLQPLVNEYPYSSNVFNAINSLGMSQVTVNRIGLTGEQLQITGEASSASALLADVSSMPWVADARFNAPVSRRNGLDRFTLVIDLNREALVNDAST